MSTPYSGGSDSQDPRNNPNWDDNSTPYGETYGQSYGQGDDQGYGAYGTLDQGYGAYNQSAFDVNSAAAGHGATRFHGNTLVDGTYGDGQMYHPVNDPEANGWSHYKGTGKINAIEAWGFGFKMTFANWKTWIAIGVIITLLPALLYFLSPFVTAVLEIALFLLCPFIYSFALLQTLSRKWKFDGFKAPAYGSTLGMLVLISVIMAAVFFAMLVVAGLLFGGSLVSNLETFDTLDPAQLESNPELLLPLLGSLMAVYSFALLLTLLAAPFFTFPAWFAADRATTFGTAFTEGVKVGARNYGQILLFYLIWGLLVLLSMFTAFIALIVITPVNFLATSYAYRQASGGPVPVTS